MPLEPQLGAAKLQIDRNVAFGSDSEVSLRSRKVRFTPINTHRQPSRSGPKSANKRLMYCSDRHHFSLVSWAARQSEAVDLSRKVPQLFGSTLLRWPHRQRRLRHPV
jgi:hypothetical protein